MSGSLIFAIQLFMLGAYTGAVLDLISFVRTLIFSNNTNKKWAQNPLWLLFFVVVMIVSGILTWNDFFSLFAILGSLLSTFALWMKKPKYTRIISLFVGPCWIIYNVVNGSIMGVVNEIIALTSIIIGIVRLDLKKNEHEPQLPVGENTGIEEEKTDLSV